mmetsp:Transcript_43536/g.51245  ORF Transcript_43536/g.51245 Transcript_43536/m.51245 type:complete len:204 (-) Transcript_43536:508-1119(-)
MKRVAAAGKAIVKFARDKVKGFDRYAKPITFTYKGEGEFTTLIGGVITIGSLVVLSLYAYIMVKILIEKKDTKTSITTSVSDLISDSDPIELKDTTFMFAFNIIGASFDILTDESYFDMTVFKYFKTKDSETGELYTDVQQIELQRCGDTFKYYNQTVIKKFGIDNYICPKSMDLTVQGNLYSDSYTYFQVKIARCSGFTGVE